jgi:glycosyltransferase involved in cell wall biosynthesis
MSQFALSGVSLFVGKKKGGPMVRVCFLSGARYEKPLDARSEKKFRLLQVLGELFVIGFAQGLRPRRFTEHARFYLFPKLPLPVLRYATLFIVGPLLALWIVFRHGVQVLVAQSPHEGFAAALAKRIARICGQRIVLVVEGHGDFEESVFRYRHVLLPRLYRFLMRRVAQFTLDQADVLRAVSQSTRQQLERWTHGKPFVQFPTWTDIDVFLHVGGEEDSVSRDILYAGVLIPLKGVHHLTNAFVNLMEDFPQTRLIIVGPEENRTYAAALRAQAGQLNLDGRVHFMGRISQVELARRMRKACVFVLPTYSEGLPRVVFEAMAVGLPVVASAVSGIPEIVQEGVTGFLVPPGDEVELAERLRWLLAHPQEAKEMGRRARIIAAQRFSTAAYVQGYQRILATAQVVLDTGESSHASAPV